jgi:predicted nucleic acid-binding protein
MIGVLVDIDILIEVLRGRKAEVVRMWSQTASEEEPLFYSPVTLAEIRHGMKANERESTERIFSAMISVPIEAEIGARAGDYLRAFQASHSLELGDALIAATASIHELTLWTQNRKHFPMKDVHFFSKAHG